jgi:hypothetical protein
MLVLIIESFDETAAALLEDEIYPLECGCLQIRPAALAVSCLSWQARARKHRLCGP